MCAQQPGSMSSMMKSSRLRFEDGARQKMPRLQMSTTCIGVVVMWVTVHVAPPLFDHTTYMSYSQDGSDCTVPAVDSAEHVAGLELALTARPKYGLPCVSVV